MLELRFDKIHTIYDNEKFQYLQNITSNIGVTKTTTIDDVIIKEKITVENIMIINSKSKY